MARNSGLYRRVFNLLLVVISLQPAESQLFGGDIDDRIGQFLLQQAEMRDDMVVFISGNIITERQNLKALKINLDKPFLIVQKKLKRFAISKKLGAERIDAIVENQLLSESSEISAPLSSVISEAQFVRESDALYFLKGTKVIQRFQRRGGNIGMSTISGRRDPMDLAISMFMSASRDNETSIFLHSFKVIGEENLANGDVVAVLLPNKEAAWKVTFANEPGWTPKEVKYYVRDQTPLPNSGNLVAADVLKWNNYSTVRTEWNLDSNSGFWLPSTTRMEMEYDGKSGSAEYRYAGWEFGKFAKDSKLFDEKEFTVIRIPKSIDFSKESLRFEAKGK